jgi:hypothetical protein
LRRPHHRDCSPARAREHWLTNRQQRASEAHRGTLSPGGGSQR